MSPVPLIARQRALARVGEIHGGDEKRDGKVGRKLDTFRLTSQHKEILETAATIYGGQVRPWQSPTGDAWQVITERAALPVLVIPGYSLKRSYELWAGPSKRERVCDGEEQSNGEPCLCNAQGRDECKLITRLMVLLPETGTSLGWQLSSTGETAADELDLAMRIVEGMAQGRPFVPATLRLTQRRGQLNGQATRFVVPVLDLDPQQPRLAAGELPPGVAVLPTGYTPIPTSKTETPSLEAGLREVEAQQLARPPRVSLPDDDDILNDDDFVSVEHSALPPGGVADTTAAAPTPPGAAAPTTDEPKLATVPQKKKLNVLVGQLRDHGHLTTSGLLGAIGRHRECDWQQIAAQATLDDGQLHWSPIRETLTRAEAMWLIDQLEDLQQKRGAA